MTDDRPSTTGTIVLVIHIVVIAAIVIYLVNR